MSAESFIDNLLEAERSAEVGGFLRERSLTLASQVEPITFVGGGEHTSYRYIHPQSVIKPRAFSKGYRLDDDSIHTLFASEILKLVKGNESLSSDQVILLAAQLAVLGYFGLADGGAKHRRKKFLGGVFRGSVRSISEVAQNRVGMCLEHAAESHNLFLLGDAPSVLVKGRAWVKGKGEVQGHAFQIVRQGSDDVLFDCTNPSITITGQDAVATPTTGQIDIAEFLVGGTVFEAELVHKVSNNEPTQTTLQYQHTSYYPATFEGVAASRFSQRAVVSQLDVYTYRQLAIKDEASHLMESAFGVG